MFSFRCEKTLLQNAAGIASRTVSPKSSIPALEGLYLQADQTGNTITVSGYNMNTGIRSTCPAEIESPGEIVVNARLFGDIIRRMPDDMISITIDNNQIVRMECDETRFEISGLSADDFPELPVVDEQSSITIRQDLLRAMIEQSAFSVSTNESRPIHTGALFEIGGGDLTMVAVDGFRLALRREKLESASDGNFSFVTPGSALNELKTICADTDDLIHITLGRQHILFETRNSDDTGNTELICRRLEGEFLDYKKAIPRDNPLQVQVERRDLIKSLDRVSVVISEKMKGPVRCKFSGDKILLSAKTGAGESRDVCYAVSPIDGDQELEIGFNSRYLLEALRYCPADTVKIELNTGVSPAIMLPVDSDSDTDSENKNNSEQENFLYMILPVRLKA